MGLLEEAIQSGDASKRLSDTVALHLVAAKTSGDMMAAVGQWCAFKLNDGTSDNTLYPSKDDAIRYQKGNPKDYCYLKITPDGITPVDAMRFLRINRHPMIDTTAPEHKINPALYPRFSNLTQAQKADLKRRAEEEAKNAR